METMLFNKVTKKENKVEKIAENILRITKNNKTFLVPEIIGGRYKVEDILSASTGFGLILTARDENVFGRKVLIKATNYKGRIKKGNIDNEEIIKKQRKNMSYELNVLKQIRAINIPNTPVLRDYIEGYCPTIHWPEGEIKVGKPYMDEYAYSEPYIVLQYIDGITLDEYLENNNIDYQSYEWQKIVLLLAKQILKMFRKMYKIGERHEKIKTFVYQDLKPGNIIITPSGNFALIDFGGVATITKTGDIANFGVSTPGYTPPEIENRDMKNKFDHRADIYTLGVMMYELLTGVKPQTTLSNNGKSQVASLDYSKLKCDPVIKEIIVKATKYDPDERYLYVSRENGNNQNGMLDDIFIALEKLGVKSGSF